MAQYERYTVIVYVANRPELPIRPALNCFDWNSLVAKEPHGILEKDTPDGYHRYEVTAYACKLRPVVTR
ncbi:MAG: hypothetical protein AAF609_24035 [Cyanobacteria bacterium P01_C01_bin.120]